MSQSVNASKPQSTPASRITVEVRELPQPMSRRIMRPQIDADGDGGDISHE